MAHEDKLIEHLSQDITTHTSYLASFRSRVAFTVLIGPLVLLGSFLIATKGEIPAVSLGLYDYGAIVVACLCYLILGVYGATLDKHVIQQCNTWRTQIESLRQDSSSKIGDISFEHKNQVTAYLTGLVLVLVAFLAIVYLLKTLL